MKSRSRGTMGDSAPLKKYSPQNKSPPPEGEIQDIHIHVTHHNFPHRREYIGICQIQLDLPCADKMKPSVVDHCTNANLEAATDRYKKVRPITRDVDIGYVTRSALRKCQGVKDLDVLLFRQNFRTCLKNVVGKLFERSLLKFPLTEALTFLNPYKIGFNQDEAMQQMTSAVDILVTSNLIPAFVARNADREYKELASQEKVKLTLKA
uniref:Uncharacterized protein n=1 Tax=Timema douglasi TaxID=61478 RepID=A0A7R8ZCW6_TIMDO|nr:unnamed protein product [Timema douglasi]